MYEIDMSGVLFWFKLDVLLYFPTEAVESLDEVDGYLFVELNGLDSLSFVLLREYDGLGSRELALSCDDRYERYLSSNGLGSRERGKLELIEVIDGLLDTRGLGSRDFSRLAIILAP